jgi:hypothetical protein
MSGENRSGRAFAIPSRPLEEIEWYLQAMATFHMAQIALDAKRALVAWTAGDYEPAQTVLARWYSTTKRDFPHELDEGVEVNLDMHEVLQGNDMKRHMDLLVQMITTLRHRQPT